ncbi:hypothetical protein LINGRAPRIM_LOCUS3229 [Linum grandiflorum]
MGDNEEDVMDWQDDLNGSDAEGEQSDVPANMGVIHLISDSDHTTDPEFLEAMRNLGVANRRRKIRTNVYANGKEVEQLNELTVNPDEAEVINDNGGPELHPGINDPSDDQLADDELDGSDSVDSDYEPLNLTSSTNVSKDDLVDADGNVSGIQVSNDSEIVSSYRASSQSDHGCVDKIDSEEISSIDMAAYYDPNCDHKYLIFREGLKFTSPTEFKDTILNYSIVVGAYIRWAC